MLVSCSGAAVAANIVAAATTAGVGGILSLVATGTTTAIYAINAYNDYNKAAQMYNVIKHYGEKE